LSIELKALLLKTDPKKDIQLIHAAYDCGSKETPAEFKMSDFESSLKIA